MYQSIQNNRKRIWNIFSELIDKLKTKKCYLIKPYKKSESAYHILALIFKSTELANSFKKKIQSQGIAATFHYVPLHKSIMGKKFCNYKLPLTEEIYSRVVRLPLYSGMTKQEIIKVYSAIKNFLI